MILTTAGERGRNRTRAIFFHSGLGLLMRFTGIAATFASMPIMLHMLGNERMGAWLVLLSILQWITFFDLGIGAGARNEIARSVAQSTHEETRTVISTGWFYMAVVMAGLLMICTFSLALTPLSKWMILRVLGNIDMQAALWVILIVSCVSFALGFIQNIFSALEKASASSAFSMLSSVIFLAILLLTSKLHRTVFEISLVYSVALIVANLALIGYFYAKYPYYRPTSKGIDHSLRPKILHFGLRIFFIQIAAMVIFTSHRLLASMLLSPSTVVIYDAAFKVFGLITMVHTLIMSTMWSSFTHAYHQSDWPWMAKSLKRLMQLMLPLSAATFLLAGISPFLIKAWLGEAQVGDFKLYIWFAIVTILSCWSNIFAYFLNGLGKTNVQLWTAIFAAALTVPLSFFFVSYLGQGISGILMATAVSLSLFSIAGPLQTRYILKTSGAEN